MESLSLDPGTLLDYASRLTVVPTLLLVIWALVTKRLVAGWAYSELKAERDELRKALDATLPVGKKAAEVAGQSAGVSEELLGVVADLVQRLPRPGSDR